MITLAEAKVGMADKVDQQVVDEFRRNSMLLDAMEWDDAVSPTGGSTLAYGYMRLETPSVGGTRALNTEYTAQEAKRKEYKTNLKVFGGSFQIDRVIAQTSGAVDEVEFQVQEKVKGTIAAWNNAVINGDEAEDGTVFDGLSEALAGSNTELNTASHIDLSTSAAMDTNYKTFMDLLDEFFALLMAKPDYILCNDKMKARLSGIARRAGYFTRQEDAFGNLVDCYHGVPILDMGYIAAVSDGSVTEKQVINTVSREFGESTSKTTVTGLTDIYALCLGRNAFHGVTVASGQMINTYLPDLQAPGAVKTGEVEMVSGIALKNTRAAGAIRNLKIQ